MNICSFVCNNIFIGTTEYVWHFMGGTFMITKSTSSIVDTLCDTCTCSNKIHVENAKRKLLDEEVIYEMADFFKIFGDSTRVKILYTLLENELCVGDLVEVLNMTQSAISHQLRVLRQNDLVKFRKEGKAVFYSLDDDHVSVLLKQGLCHMLHKNGGVKN